MDASADAQRTEPANGPAASAPPSCDMCHLLESRYRCPACAMRTCSVVCVRRHKKETGCVGVASKAASFVPKNDYAESHLRSDLSFLEQAKRTATPVTRLSKNAVKARSGIRSRAKRQKVDLHHMPEGMARQARNTSRAVKQGIEWRIEWVRGVCVTVMRLPSAKFGRWTNPAHCSPQHRALWIPPTS